MMTLEPQRLETERLVLRMWQENDLAAYARICADPEVMRFLSPQGLPLTVEESWRQIAYLIGHWHLRGYGLWAVEEKTTGNLVGRVGFNNPHGWPGFELGWTLGREYWGRGYATEAARHILEYGFTDLAKEHIISVIHPDNFASIRVAERLGEQLEGETEVRGIRVRIYGISREAWQDKL